MKHEKPKEDQPRQPKQKGWLSKKELKRVRKLVEHLLPADDERPEADGLSPFSEVIDVATGESLGIFETDIIANDES